MFTNSTILAIKSVSWSGHSFVGLTETDQLVTYNVHESKDFKLNVADMEIWKNNKLDMFIFFMTMYILKSVPNVYTVSIL